MARMGDRRGVYRVLVGNLEGKNHLEDLDADGRIILRWIFRMWDGGHGLDLSGSGQGHVAGPCDCGNEPSGTIKRGEHLD